VLGGAIFPPLVKGGLGGWPGETNYRASRSLSHGCRAISFPRSGVGTALGPLLRPVCRGDAEHRWDSPTRERGSEAFTLHGFPIPGEPVPLLQSRF